MSNKDKYIVCDVCKATHTDKEIGEYNNRINRNALNWLTELDDRFTISDEKSLLCPSCSHPLFTDELIIEAIKEKGREELREQFRKWDALWDDCDATESDIY